VTADREEVVDWVLEPFDEDDRRIVPEVIRQAVQSVREFVTEGLTAAINRTNAIRLGPPEKVDPSAE
jgi:peptidyl-tRNA hydrolase